MILLDTQVVLWWLVDDPRLGDASRELLADTAERVAVSAVSVFEVETKRRLGKLTAPPDFLGAVVNEGFELMALSAEQAELAGRADWDHRDPFDRLLVAQSQSTGSTLLSGADEILRHAGARATDARR